MHFILSYWYYTQKADCKLHVFICIFLESTCLLKFQSTCKISYYDAPLNLIYTHNVFIIHVLGAYSLDAVQDTPTTALVVEHEVDRVIVQSVSCDVAVLLLH